VSATSVVTYRHQPIGNQDLRSSGALKWATEPRRRRRIDGDASGADTYGCPVEGSSRKPGREGRLDNILAPSGGGCRGTSRANPAFVNTEGRQRVYRRLVTIHYRGGVERDTIETTSVLKRSRIRLRHTAFVLNTSRRVTIRDRTAARSATIRRPSVRRRLGRPVKAPQETAGLGDQGGWRYRHDRTAGTHSVAAVIARKSRDAWLEMHTVG